LFDFFGFKFVTLQSVAEQCECVLIGQRSEMIRQKLEKVDVCSDKQAFISACGTGMEKPGVTWLCRMFYSVSANLLLRF